ncbi:MAG: hypothetical protein HY960_10885 [Ignavibacteriae bacterium]|nr:hypothetical protein [Ignavibacteriota bacterium]
MKTNASQSEQQQLAKAYVVLKNGSEDAELRPLLVNCGYTDERMGEGWELYNIAIASTATKKSVKAKQKEASKAEDFKQLEIHKKYMSLKKTSLAHLTPTDIEILGFNSAVPRTEATFLNAARIAYKNSLETDTIKTELAKWGYNGERLVAEQAEVEVYAALSSAQSSAVGTTQSQTKDKKTAFANLAKWITAFVKTAEAQLMYTHPQLLEKLGKKVLSGPTKAQRLGKKKAAATRAAKKAAKGT